MGMARRIEILGVGVDDVTPEEALARCLAILDAGQKGYVATPNPEFIYACRHDAEARALLAGAALVVPDGVGLIHAARILRRPLRARVPGADLAEALAAELAKSGRSLYLLGAKPGVAEEAARKLREKYPGLRVAGTHHGYFQDPQAMIAEIRAAAPDVTFVCTGFPRQERFMTQALEQLPAGLMLGLGGSLDVFAGVVPRAPRVMRRLGLEWLYRLAREPRRIGRMSRIPLVLLFALRERWRTRP